MDFCKNSRPVWVAGSEREIFTLTFTDRKACEFGLRFGKFLTLSIIFSSNSYLYYDSNQRPEPILLGHVQTPKGENPCPGGLAI